VLDLLYVFPALGWTWCVLDLLCVGSALDLLCVGPALCWICSFELLWICSVLDLLSVGSTLCWISSGSAQCRSSSSLDIPLKTLNWQFYVALCCICSGSALDRLCVGSALFWSCCLELLWICSLCWICSVLDLLFVEFALDLLCVGSALC
jgi:hypothetical protein